LAAESQMNELIPRNDRKYEQWGAGPANE
jgi:hypothetical protein